MVSIMIQVGDRTIKVEGDDEKYVEDKIAELEKKYLESNSVEVSDLSSQEKKLAINSGQTRAEFFRKTKPDSNTEVVLALGYYRERLSKEGGFTQRDILNDYQEVHKAKPANIADVFIRTKKLGWIRKLDNSNWNITQTGEEKINKLVKQE